MYFERTKIVKIRDFWFEEDRNLQAEKGGDYAEYHDIMNLPSNKEGYMGHMSRMTLVSNLEKSDEEIQSQFRKNTRYEIRRAKKENCFHRFYLCKGNNKGTEVEEEIDGLLHRIDEEHAKLFLKKGIRTKDEYTFMYSAAKKGMLAVSVGFLQNGDEGAYHVYIVGNGMARLLHSISVFRETNDNEERNAIGRLNRFLHYMDMVELKQLGFNTYDWGGYSEKEEHKTISDFKMSFGGEKKRLYTVYYSTSVIGKILSIIVKERRLKGHIDE